MRHTVLAVLMLSSAAACFGQTGRTYNSLGGFGNVVYPGTGHAPNVNPGPFSNRLGSTVSGYPYYAPRASHPSHSRSSVVPYPVIVGGYFGGYPNYYDPSAQGQVPQEGPPPIINTNSAPSVLINQTFVPDRAVPVVQDYTDQNPETQAQQPSGMRLYEGLRTPQYVPPARRAVPDDEPTLYLIAFKDHTVVPALGYWVEGGSLHYVSAEHTLNQASLDLIDRALSQRLNDERNVEFKLPKSD